MTDIRVTNSAIMVESDDAATDIRVTNASIGVEYTDTATYIRVTNASINIEYTETVNYIHVENAAIMVESWYQVTPEDCEHLVESDIAEIEVISGVVYHTAGLAAYGDFYRDAKTYFSRADEEGTSITTALTLGCWCWFDDESTDVATGLMSKWYETGNQRSYALFKDATNNLTFIISDDGTNEYSINDGAANYDDSKWFFVVGRFDPNDELALFVNGTWYTDTTGIPAAIYDSTEALEFGRKNRTDYLDGRMCHAFLCACAVPDVFIEAMYAHTKSMFMGR